jgi:FkbM family methyltransferase
MSGLFSRLAASVWWRYCLWVKRGRLRIGGKLVDTNTPLISRATFKFMTTGNYEAAERQLLAFMADGGYIRRGDRVLEAGGGLGILSMNVADIVGDDAVVVFEAHPRTAAVLQANLTLNRHSIRIERKALVADDRGDVAFADAIDASGFGSSSTHRIDPAMPTITVPAETLAAAIRRIDPTVLVIDVEGAEHDLLASVSDWGRLRSIHMEMHPDVLPAAKIDAMLRRLDGQGFRLVEAPIADKNVVLLSRATVN